MNKLRTCLLGAGLATSLPTAGALAAHGSNLHNRKGTDGTFRGPKASMQWGSVQVTIVVKSGKIVTVKATAPHHTSRSKLINSIALPLLRKEVLKAQNAKIHTLSGATLTSQAYIKSLQGALKQAGLPLA